MALGQSLFNNRKAGNGSNNRSVNVYCGYRFRMPDGNKDKAPTGIDISYWNNMLKLTIAHLVKSNGNNGEYYTMDRDNRADAFLTPVKARILANEIRKFIDADGAIKSAGVTTGKTLVTVSTGEEFEVAKADFPCITIRKFSDDASKIEMEIFYEINADYYFGVHNFNRDDMDGEHNTDDYKYIELENLITILEDFYNGMAYGSAYASARAVYDYSPVGKLLNDLSGEGNSSSGSNTMNNSGGFSNGSLDDL